MTNRKAAGHWCFENSESFLSSVQLSPILCMEDYEAAEAFERFFSTDFIVYDSASDVCFCFYAGHECGGHHAP